MNRPRLIRGLQIAWTAAWGVLCVLLVVLWVRSKTWQDVFTMVAPTDQQFHSALAEDGLVRFTYVPNIYPETRWESIHVPLSERSHRVLSGNYFGFRLNHRNNPWKETTVTTLTAPYWFLTLLSVSFASLPYLPWKFSLRTLLIATTAVAVILGLVIYATR
jgi:hypothetical protein